MGGAGSGRKPDPVKRLIGFNQPAPTGVSDVLYLPNLSGVKPEALKTSAEPLGITDHSALTNLNWAVAGHTVAPSNYDFLVDIDSGAGKENWFYIDYGGDTVFQVGRPAIGSAFGVPQSKSWFPLVDNTYNLGSDGDNLLWASGYFGTSLHLKDDNAKQYFGADNDASIYYDGTDLIVNPKEVGSGQLKVSGNLTLPITDTQVVYSDSGKLVGDAGLTFDDATNMLVNDDGSFATAVSGVNQGYLTSGVDDFVQFSRNAYLDGGGTWQRTQTGDYSVLNQLMGRTTDGEFRVFTSAPAANPITNWVERFTVDHTGLVYTTGTIGIGTGTFSLLPKLHINLGNVTGADYDTDDVLVLEDNKGININMIIPTNAEGGFFWSDDERAMGGIQYDHATDSMQFWTNQQYGTNHWVIDSGGDFISQLDNQKITWGAAGASDSYLQWDGSGLDRYSSGGLHNFQAAADTDITLNFEGTTNSGVMKWMEDEDYFDFTDEVKLSGNVRVGTHTAIGAETVTGYITIKDSGGTSRKIAVVS